MSQSARGLSAFLVAGSILLAAPAALAADPTAIADELVAFTKGSSTTRTATYETATENGNVVTITNFAVDDTVNHTHAFVAEITIADIVEQEDGGFIAATMRLTDGNLSDEVNFVFWDAIELVDVMVPPVADLSAEGGPIVPLTAADIAGLVFDVPEGADLTLGGATLQIGAIVPDQPVTATVTMTGLQAPVSLIGESDVTTILRAMGFDVLNMDLTVTGQFDAANDTLIADQVSINIEGIGHVDVSGTFVGVPLGMIQDPGGIDELIASAKVESVRIRFENGGAMDTFMRVQAEMMGIPPEDAAGALAVVFQLLLGTYEDPTLAQRVGVPVGAFLRNPQAITFEATLAEPVELPIIIDALLRAPEMLFSILDVVVTAND